MWAVEMRMRGGWVRLGKYAVGAVGVVLALRLLSPFILPLPHPPPLLHPVQLQSHILELSKVYVSKLAGKQADLQDNPYRHYGTAYDLKKTLAILLLSVNERLDNIESQIRVLAANGSVNLPNKGNIGKDALRETKALLDGKQELCPELPDYSKEAYPASWVEVGWMRGLWRSDPCYAGYGVDGSLCSFRIYLSEVESHCPRLPWRPVPTPTNTPRPNAVPDTDLGRLFALMTDNEANYEWIRGRLERLWAEWVSALEGLRAKSHWLSNRRPRRILLHLGSLTKESGFKLGASADSGGPLGELVQWSDLIAALFLLGHSLTISSEIKTFVRFAQADPALKSSCPVAGKESHVDLVFTDIVGFRQMKRKIPGSLQNYKCRLRVLDSFGTEAEFNNGLYFTTHKKQIGGHALRLPQFYTMFPHTPDNTFLGFVVETFPNLGGTPPPRNNWALVYGKAGFMWREAREVIEVVQSEGLEVHGTVGGDTKDIPHGVVNHGVLSGKELHHLLRQVKVFLGLGFPFEGPAPLEAIANGAVFLNPRFQPPRGRGTHPFFAEKPTLRQLTSQNPYAEEYIGQPHVLTVDINNSTALRHAIRKAMRSTPDALLPYEMTYSGMLERLGALVENQEFCSEKNSNWPPFAAAKIILGPTNASCVNICRSQGLICEPAWWEKVNHVELISGLVEGGCTGRYEAEPDTPYLAPDGKCVLESERFLFSCASVPRGDNRRFCPCRDFVKGQVALCAACL